MTLSLTLENGTPINVPDVRLYPKWAGEYWLFGTRGFSSSVAAWCYAEERWAGWVAVEDLPGEPVADVVQARAEGRLVG